MLLDSRVETCSVEMEAFSKPACNLSLLSEAQLSQEDAIALLLQDKATPDAPQTLDSSTPGGVSDGASDVSSHSHHADSEDGTDQLETNPGLTMSPL